MDTTQYQPNSSGKLQSILLAAAFLLFAGFAVFGIFKGKDAGRDKATFANLASINSALSYYKNDQGRYPTEAQYSNEILVPLYISSMPEPVNATGSCSAYSQFQYSQSSPQSFKIQFCLNSGVSGISAGVHSLTEKGVQ